MHHVHGRGPGHRPAHRVVRVRLRPAVLGQPLQEVRDVLRRAVEVGPLVEGAVQPADGGPAVVARDVDDDGVVLLPHLVDRVDEAADLDVRVFGVARVHLHLPGQNLLRVVRERVPLGDVRRVRGELGARRHQAHLDLPRQGLLAELVPALVELALVLVQPLLRRRVRRVGAARGVVHEERPVRGHRPRALHPGDGLVRDVRAEVVVRVARHAELGRPVHEVRVEQRVLARDEAVELLEPLPCRPAVERPADARLPRRGLVALAEHGRAVPPLTQDLGERGDAQRPDRRIARVRRGPVHHGARAALVLVAAGEQGVAAGRAQAVDVEVRVRQPFLRELVERRELDRPAEGGRVAVGRLVEQDDDDVGRALGRPDLERLRLGNLPPVRFGDRSRFGGRIGNTSPYLNARDWASLPSAFAGSRAALSACSGPNLQLVET